MVNKFPNANLQILKNAQLMEEKPARKGTHNPISFEKKNVSEVITPRTTDIPAAKPHQPSATNIFNPSPAPNFCFSSKETTAASTPRFDFGTNSLTGTSSSSSIFGSKTSTATVTPSFNLAFTTTPNLSSNTEKVTSTVSSKLITVPGESLSEPKLSFNFSTKEKSAPSVTNVNFGARGISATSTPAFTFPPKEPSKMPAADSNSLNVTSNESKTGPEASFIFRTKESTTNPGKTFAANSESLNLTVKDSPGTFGRNNMVNTKESTSTSSSVFHIAASSSASISTPTFSFSAKEPAVTKPFEAVKNPPGFTFGPASGVSVFGQPAMQSSVSSNIPLSSHTGLSLNSSSTVKDKSQGAVLTKPSEPIGGFVAVSGSSDLINSSSNQPVLSNTLPTASPNPLNITTVSQLITTPSIFNMSAANNSFQSVKNPDISRSSPQLEGNAEQFKQPISHAVNPGSITSLHQGKTNGDEDEVAGFTAQLDRASEQNIREELNSFNLEFEAFMTSFKKVTEKDELIGDADELRNLNQSVEDATIQVESYKTIMAENKSESSELREKLLKNFQMIDEALLRKEKMDDKRYINVLRSRPLDPISARQRKEMREHFLYIEDQLNEINNILDSKWQEMQNKRSGRSNYSKAQQNQQIYKTMEAIDTITNHLTSKVGNLKLRSEESYLISMNLSRQPSANDSSKLSKFSKFNLNRTNELNDESPKKLSKLRKYLVNRGKTPMRKTKDYAVRLITSTDMESTINGKLDPKAASTPAYGTTKSFEKFSNKMPVLDEEAYHIVSNVIDKVKALSSTSPKVLDGTPETKAIPKAPENTPVTPQVSLDPTKAHLFKNSLGLTPSGTPNKSFANDVINKNLFASPVATRAFLPKQVSVENSPSFSSKVSIKQETVSTTTISDTKAFTEDSSPDKNQAASCINTAPRNVAIISEKLGVTPSPSPFSIVGNSVVTTSAATFSFGFDKFKTGDSIEFAKPTMSSGKDDSNSLNSSVPRVDIFQPKQNFIFGSGFNEKEKQNTAQPANPKEEGISSITTNALSAEVNVSVQTAFSVSSISIATSAMSKPESKPASTGFLGATTESKVPSAGFFVGTSKLTSASTGLFGLATGSKIAPGNHFGATSESKAAPKGLQEAKNAEANTTSLGIFETTMQSNTFSTALFEAKIETKQESTITLGKTIETKVTSSSLLGATFESKTASTGLIGTTAEPKPSVTGLSVATTESNTSANLFGTTAISKTSTAIPFGRTIKSETPSVGIFGATNGSNVANAEPKTISSSLFISSIESKPNLAVFGSSGISTAAPTGFLTAGSEAKSMSTGHFESSFSKVSTISQSNDPLVSSVADGNGTRITTASTTSGLFGSIAVSSSKSSTLFGNKELSSSSGLFGNNNVSTTTGLGLFSSTGGSNLFGTPTSTTSGGLFSNTLDSKSGAPTSSGTAVSTGGLFGNTGGLFGGSSTTTSASGNLFGNQTNSLFGDVSKQSSGLFSSTATTPGSAFASSSSSANQTNSGGLFGNKSTFGTPLTSANTFASKTEEISSSSGGKELNYSFILI